MYINFAAVAAEQMSKILVKREKLFSTKKKGNDCRAIPRNTVSVEGARAREKNTQKLKIAKCASLIQNQIIR